VGTTEHQRARPLHSGASSCVDPTSWLPSNALLTSRPDYRTFDSSDFRVWRSEHESYKNPTNPSASTSIVVTHKPHATTCTMDPGPTSQPLLYSPGFDRDTWGTPRRPAGATGTRHIPHPSEPPRQIEATRPQRHGLPGRDGSQPLGEV
jgi:hypothetical protein